MNYLELTAITNAILAAELFLVAGIVLGRLKNLTGPRAWWGFGVAILALSSLLGAIDHDVGDGVVLE